VAASIAWIWSVANLFMKAIWFVPKYLYFTTFPKDLLWFCPTFWWRDRNI
jgi:hypothetical protein